MADLTHTSARFFPWMIALVLLVGGCGGASDEEASSGTWTIQEDALALTETLRAGDDEDFYFGEIHDVAVRGDGRMYVADGKASHVKVLAPDGTLQDTIGRAGEGPGEFKGEPRRVTLAHGDSLYVLHGGYLGHLSAFGPNHEFAYQASFRAGDARVPDLPREIIPIPGASEYLVVYTPPPLQGKRKDNMVRRAGPKGTVGDTLFTYPPAQVHIEQNNGGITIRSIPFARRSQAVGDAGGNVHYAWSDSLGVRMYGPGGELRRITDIPFEPVPVTEADREQKLPDRSNELVAAVADKIPSTKPAFEQFLVDDAGRYWFGRPTANPDSTAWWVADPDEKRVVTATLPSEVELEVVKNGSAYGKTTTNDGAPALVRYRIRESSN